MRVAGRQFLLVVSVLAFSGTISSSVPATIEFTILHTNDFHGQLEASDGGPGLARVAAIVDQVRTERGREHVLLADAGDQWFGSLLSNLGKGAPTVDAFNKMHYDVAALGNHDFDWGESVLSARKSQAEYPFIAANVVQGKCDPDNWNAPPFVQPYVVKQVGTPNPVRVGFIGVTTTEVPTITAPGATRNLCFKDPAEAIVHYHDILRAQTDVIVVLSHLGYEDGGYGYGIAVYGDKTLADKLYKAGKPVPLIIGGHSHTDVPTPLKLVDDFTMVVQASYNGRQIGRVDLSFDPNTKKTQMTWRKLPIRSDGPADPIISGLIGSYASNSEYRAMLNRPVGYSLVDLTRNGGVQDNMMGAFINDALYGYLNNDADKSNDVDIFLNNAGGIRTDLCAVPDSKDRAKYIASGNATTCTKGLYAKHGPMLLTYGNLFLALPFGNSAVVGAMTGAQILQVLNYGPRSGKGVIQPAGLKYKYYAYKDNNPGPQPYAWGAFDVCVINRLTQKCDALDLNKSYRVGTNEFLAPTGGDGYRAFRYITGISYWGDMLNLVASRVGSKHGTPGTAYKGPVGDGKLDGRIARDGTETPDSGSITPITILHNNDSHGNLAKSSYLGYTQLATLIGQERAHNPRRTLLLNAGDQIQGDATMYYFKSAPSGFAADGTSLPAALQMHPMMAVMNALHYDAMTIGNHEFNFGRQVFKEVLAQATFSVLQANISDTGAYGLSEVPLLKPFIERNLDGIKVAIIGIGNHRVPNYELPSNIPGLSFANPISTAQTLASQLRGRNDVVIALTHIGFTADPKSVEVDANVDTAMAAQVSGLDAIVGGHSHTSPVAPGSSYEFLPTIIGGPQNAPVLVSQASRYNTFLGEVVIGLRPKPRGGYDVVSRTGDYIAVTKDTPEDANIKTVVDPYLRLLNDYTARVIGRTEAPIDSLKAFTEETNAANLQADAAIFELAKNGITADFHLSGAMTNRRVAAGAVPRSPAVLKVSDMFDLMPYENSLVVLRMNGPQIKRVLERAYRNYYYYKYVPGYGGYSYYTTCMVDINAGGRITYREAFPGGYDPSNSYVLSLEVGGKAIDLSDTSTYYRVSTVNYLAAGSCNFNDNGVSLWPLDQVVNDSQLYVRDSVIDYIQSKGSVAPAIENRLRSIAPQ